MKVQSIQGQKLLDKLMNNYKKYSCEQFLKHFEHLVPTNACEKVIGMQDNRQQRWIEEIE